MISSIRRFAWLGALALIVSPIAGSAQAKPPAPTPFVGDSHPLEFGVLAQGGVGLTEDRNSFKFLMFGGRAGKVLISNVGPGLLHGNFEYGIEVFPFWQSYTPKFQREMCTDSGCSAPYTVGGTFTGVSITPIQLRWNFTGSGHRKIVPFVQGGGGVIWTNHKYPAFGGPPYNTTNDGTAANTSVWNFTPQFGVGAHYFVRPHQSLDIGANAIHISSSSLGDKNPGVNASVQFSIGYSWWK
ncbi:MAG: acyloxyacyl hydrolase [Edaphobacter sp.]|uniref:acyloxyacyl hydrolase n=1 Tax=Edaphobacter sp. TaxID=1934404 RepID=UPI00239223DC|nr:acyloxyacyl hydrolase [Edaphobacter sp.]MDE1175139.1 acyloxyacyl hydrolase [Edaphobacter sp.]